MKFFLIPLLALIGWSLEAANLTTGDQGLDAALMRLDSGAQSDLPRFKSDLQVRYGVKPVQTEKYLKAGTSPSQLFFAAALSQKSHRPLKTVLQYAGSSKSWTEVAKRAGVKPTSVEFKQLKKSVTKKASNESLALMKKPSMKKKILAKVSKAPETKPL